MPPLRGSFSARFVFPALTHWATQMSPLRGSISSQPLSEGTAARAGVDGDDATPHPALRFAQGHPLPAARGEGLEFGHSVHPKSGPRRGASM